MVKNIGDFYLSWKNSAIHLYGINAQYESIHCVSPGEKNRLYSRIIKSQFNYSIKHITVGDCQPRFDYESYLLFITSKGIKNLFIGVLD